MQTVLDGIRNSCKDNLEPSPTTTPVESKISIEEAKKWFNQAQSFGNAAARTSGQSIEREALWDFARHVKNKKNREGVLIPLRFKDKKRLAIRVKDSEAPSKLWIKEQAVVFKNKKGDPEIYILQIASLDPRKVSLGMTDFDGWVICTTYEGKPLWGQKWKDGEVVRKLDVTPKNARMAYCHQEDMGYDTYGVNEAGEFEITHHLDYQWVDCGDGGGGGGGGSGGSGGGGGGGGNGGGSGGSGDAPAPGDYVEEAVASFYIINKLKKPCFISAYSSIKNNSQSLNRIQAIFSNFNSSIIYSFTIDEVYDNYSNIKTAPGRHDNGTIYLNDYSLEYSSQEMIVATILHEMLHVHILSTGDADHDTMASQYVQLFAEAMMSIFPNLSQSHAIALAWGGLQGTTAWGQMGALQDPILSDIYKYWNYRNSNTQPYGTPCP